MTTAKRKVQGIKKLLRRDIERFGGEWLTWQPVFLGDYTETVISPTGLYYARQYNGKVIEVFNAANVQAKYDLHVIVGKKKTQPKRWQIIEERDVYLEPPTAGGVGFHAHQHMYEGADRVPIRRKQIIEFTVQVSNAADFIVAVNGGVTQTTTGIRKVPTTFLDLSPYVVTSGAKYIGIELNDSGALSLHEGTGFASLLTATDSDVPVPDADNHLIAFVAMYETQETLQDKDIYVLMPLAMFPTIPETHWEPVTVSAEKEFHRWNIPGALATTTDAAESVLIIRSMKLRLAYIHCKNNGSASSTIIDINLNGSTIFTTTANRPELGNAETYNVSGTPDIIDLVPGDVLTMDIDQIATGASDLTILLTETIHDLVYVGDDLVMLEVSND
jgi:hypothetical protein